MGYKFTVVTPAAFEYYERRISGTRERLHSGWSRSTDGGVTWEPISPAPFGDSTYNTYAWDGTYYVAVGNNRVARSLDTVSWTSVVLPTRSSTGFFDSWPNRFASNGAGRWVATGNAYKNEVAVSADSGATWTKRTLTGARSVVALAWSGTQFGALCQVVDAYAVFTSPDGDVWTQRGILNGDNFQGDLVQSFVGVGNIWGACRNKLSGSVADAEVSPDGGDTWIEVAHLATTSAIVALDGRLLTIGGYDDYRFFDTADGLTWQEAYVQDIPALQAYDPLRTTDPNNESGFAFLRSSSESFNTILYLLEPGPDAPPVPQPFWTGLSKTREQLE